MIKIVSFCIFLSLFAYGLENKPYWLDGKKIPYRYYGIKGVFLHKKGKHYTINLAKNLAIKELINKLNHNKNLTENNKIILMNRIHTKQYKSENGRIYIFVYIY